MAISIAPMTSNDLDFAMAMADAENWGYLRSDFERMLNLSPGGCFIARGTFRRIGMITTVCHGDYGFIGSLIVMKGHRGSGIGHNLFEHALLHLRSQNVRTVEIDAVFTAVNIYRRIGFHERSLSLRFKRSPAPTSATPGSQMLVPLDDLVRFDRDMVGIDRSAVLSRFYDTYRDSLFAVGADRLRAYAFVRPRAEGTLAVGPLVAESSKDAAALLRTIVSRHQSDQLAIGVPEEKQEFVQLLISDGFYYRLPSLRMYFGTRIDVDEHVYGILSPDKG